MSRKRKRLFRAKDMLSVQAPMQLAASEDGGQVAFVMGEAVLKGSKQVSRLWVLDEGEVCGARQMSFGEDSRSQPAFSPDGTRLAYLTVQDKKTQLAVVKVGFAEPKVITDFLEGVRGFRWHPSGKSLLVLAPEDPPERKRKAVEERDDSHEVDVDEPCSRMWVVPVGGGKARRIGPRHGHVSVADWSPDGKSVVYVAGEHVTLDFMWRETGLHVLNVASGRGRLLRRLTSAGASSTMPSFSPDGSRVVFCDTPLAGAMHPQCLFTMGVKGGRAVRIDRGTDRTAHSPTWLDDTTVMYLQQQQTSTKLRSAPVNGKAGRTLVAWPGEVSGYSLARGSGRVFFAYSETDKPQQVYSVALGVESEPECLTGLNRSLRGVRLSVGELVKWKAPDGLAIEGWLYRPTKRVRAPYAMVVIPHGGPQSAITNDFGRSVGAQAYCAAGYAVFMPNFRGSTGYGEAFMLKIRRNWGPGPASDVLSGVKMLVRRKIADRKRLVLQGGSYGGYMTAWLVGHSRLFRAAVAHAPVVNKVSMWGTTDIVSWDEWQIGGTPLEEYKMYWALSPVAHLKGCTTPTLVMTGEEDVRVPPNQSYELYRTLRAAGVPTGLVLYPREPHGIGEPRHRLDVLRRVLGWFERHLGSDAP